MLKILNVTPNEDYSLDICFDDGENKRCSIRPYLEKGIFRKLTNIVFFKQVKSSGFCVEWPNQAELSSDTLYAIGSTRQKAW